LVLARQPRQSGPSALVCLKVRLVVRYWVELLAVILAKTLWVAQLQAVLPLAEVS
jgi:hypothetical protein